MPVMVKFPDGAMRAMNSYPKIITATNSAEESLGWFKSRSTMSTFTTWRLSENWRRSNRIHTKRRF